MSEMLDNIFTKNFLNLALEEAFLPKPSQLKGPGRSRLNRSASFFSPLSPPSHSLSAEHVDDDDADGNNGPFWSSNIWSQGPVSKPKPLAFRPDRSMSLTESGGGGGLLLSSAFPAAASSAAVAPPPGFPASSALPPQVQPPVAPNRYKTELCRGFQETGSCKYGTKCQFAHGEEELRGLFRHPKYKTEPCRTFYNFGYCPYGSRCHFIHEDKSGGSPLSTAKFRDQQQAPGAGGQNPRHPLRQSVSFGGFLGSSRSSPPPSFLSSINDPNLGFSRAHSVSPPPAALLSPVFGGGGGGSLQKAAAAAATAFHFGNRQTRASAGDIHSIPLLMEPQKASHCVCGHGNNFNGRAAGADGDGGGGGAVVAFPGAGGHRGFAKPAGLQRFSSEDSLEDSYSSSSGGSSGTESPTFDAATKRLTVFERLSLSD
ncbi:mRNA decay activator protein ZFP36 [Pseudoliparis swirei]|uniref:mRNA decay activator protein ZFP36 n=1 Tax=Pseudoliparis swirei TaxID=2059687 RepID=UPI0024BD892F|nr:mRNA decay activator protein ZFP36 [Pseudoliparis swirei]